MRLFFWKEFRENWPIVLVGIIFAGFVNFITFTNRELVGMASDPKYLLVIVPLFISMLIANIFATEFAHKTLPFLLILPISRNRLWIYKAVIGLLLSIILVCGTIGSIVLTSHLTPKPVSLDTFFNFTGTELNDFISVGFLFYAVALFCSVLVTSNTIAAGGSALVFTMFFLLIWFITTEVFYLSDKWYGGLFIPIIILICSSWYIFQSLDLVLVKNRVTRGLSFLSITLIIVSCILILIQSNWDSVTLEQVAEISNVQLLPDNNTVICRIIKKNEYRYATNGRYWLISLKDGSYKKYPGKGYELFYVKEPVSPDKKYLIIGGNRGIFNLVESRLVKTRLGIFDTKTYKIKQFYIKQSGIFTYVNFHDWSPDSRKVLYEIWSLFDSRGRLYYLDIYTGETKEIKFKKPLNWWTYPRWAPDGNSIYLLSLDEVKDKKFWTLYHIALNGNILWKHTQNDEFGIPNMAKNRTWILLGQNATDTSETKKLYLLNLHTLETTLIFEGLMFKSRSRSPDEKWLAISAITQLQKGQKLVQTEPTTGRTTTRNIYELWLVNLETMQKIKLIPKFDAELKGWSPDSKKIMFAEYSEREKRYGSQWKAIDIESKKIDDTVSWEYGDILLPDGNYLRMKNNRLLIVTPDGKTVRQVFPS